MYRTISVVPIRFRGLVTIVTGRVEQAILIVSSSRPPYAPVFSCQLVVGRSSFCCMQDRPCFKVRWIVLPPDIAVEFEVVAVTSSFDEVDETQVERLERTPTAALAASGPEGPASDFRDCIEPAIELLKGHLAVVGDTSERRFWLRSDGGVINAEHTPAAIVAGEI